MTDVQALERYAASGDPDAFRHLVTCYQRLVYAACARRLRDENDIEDAVQETFLKLAQHAGRIKTSVSGWLYTAATRVCLDRIRRDSTRRRYELAWRPEDGDDHAEHYDALMKSVDDAIAELPEKQRDVLVQYFLEGKTQTALAKEAGVTQSAIARRVEKAVTQLRESLRARGVAAPVAAVGSFFLVDAAQAQVPAALTASLTKLGLSGAGAATTGAVTGGGLLTTLGQAALPVKLAAGLGAAGVVTAAVTLTVPDEPEAVTPTPAVMSTTGQIVETPLEGGWVGTFTTSPESQVRLRFEGANVAFSQTNPPFDFSGRVTDIDTDTDPGRIDVVLDDCSNEVMIGMSYRGIFRLNDDGSVWIATRDPDVDPVRPENFEEVGSNGVMLIKATRQEQEAVVAEALGRKAVDHGMILEPVDVPSEFVLMRTIETTPEQVAMAIPMMFMQMERVLEDAKIEVTGMAEMRFADPPEPEGDAPVKWPMTLMIPVAWEDDLPAPFRFADSEPFVGVEYVFEGTVMEIATAAERAIEQAIFDGHELTGNYRELPLRWLGPASDENVFAIQLEIVPED